MKILRVSGKNITTFDRFELDFMSEPLRSCGLFAITGATGSGKSSLLDAICLSLYGRTPRYSNHGGIKIGRPDDHEKNRLLANDPRALMSYGTGFIETEVDFTRDHKRFYRAKWYAQRSHKKPEGTFQAVTQELYEILDLPLNPKSDAINLKLIEGTKITEVRRSIEEHVGLKYEEFCRTVFLAQGEFDAFLKREDERSKLLELITGDQLYSRISQIAQDRLKVAEEHVSQLRAGVEHDLLEEEEVQRVQNELHQSESIVKESREVQRNAQRAELAIMDLQGELKKYQELKLRIEEDSAALNLEFSEITEEVEHLFKFKDLLDAGRYIQTLEHKLHSIRRTKETVLEEDRLETKIEEDLKITLLKIDEELQQRAGDQAQHLIRSAELKHTEERIKSSEERLANIDQELDSIDKKKISKQADIAEAESVINDLNLQNHRHMSKLATQGHYQRLVHHQERWAELFRILHELGDKVKVKRQEISEQTSHYKSITNSIKSLDQEWSAAELRRVSISNRTEQLERSLSEEELYSRRQRFARCEATLVNVKTARGLIVALHEELMRLIDIKDKSQVRKTSLSKAQTEMSELLIQLRMNEALLKELESSLIKTEAELTLAPLRELLIEGDPCPLCGSKTHERSSFEDQDQHSSTTRLRIAELNEERNTLQARREELHREITQGEQAIILSDEQRTSELDRCEEKLKEWRTLCTHESWREEIQKRPSISAYTRLLLSDIWPNESQINDSLIEELSEALREIEDQSAEEGRELNQSIAGMIHEQRLLDSLREELSREELTINHFEEKKFSLEQDLQAVHDTGTGLSKEREDLEAQINEYLRQLEVYAPDEISCTETHELLVLQEDWTRLCLAWREEQQTHISRLESLEVKTQVLKRAQEDLKEILNKRTLLIPVRESLVERIQMERSTLTHLSVLLSESLEGERLRLNLFTQREEQQLQLDHCVQAKISRQLTLGGLEAQISSLEEEIKTENTLYQALKDGSDLMGEEIASYLTLWQGLDTETLHQERERRSVERQAVNELTRQLAHIESVLIDRVSVIPKPYVGEFTTLPKLEDLGELSSEHGQEKIRSMIKFVRDQIRTSNSTMEAALLLEAKSRETLNKHKAALAKQDDESEEVRAAIAETKRLRVMVKTLGGGGKFGGFNAYAQRFTLEMIIEHANHYLKQLMNRYQLEMIEDDKKPLNFQVIDKDLGDEVRSVNSLSGGESFLISLALALGLSSTSSQNTHIESLFIDEGFGTLDPQSLDMAISMLDQLQVQGITIGIISHVEGIAERIGTQVQVGKTSAGKSKVLISQHFNSIPSTVEDDIEGLGLLEI